MKNAMIVLLTAYCLISTFLLIKKFPEMDDIQLLNALHDCAHERGFQYSMWAFGQSWDTVPFSQAIGVWNKKHPSPNMQINPDMSFEEVIKRFGMIILSHQEEIDQWNH